MTYCINEQKTENTILSEFVEFLRKNQDAIIITWNMKNTTYGFPHIEQRCKAHNITTNLPIKQENITDLDDVLEEKFGKSYISNPKLKQLANLNKINLTSFIDGKDEITLYENKNYRVLENSVNRKVSIIDDILDLAFTNKLKTESSLNETANSLHNSAEIESKSIVGKKEDIGKVSGFGTSINVEKRKLIIQNKLKNEKLEFYPHQIDHDSIIVDGHMGSITFESMRWLMKHDINLTLLNWNGNLLGITLPQEPKLGRLRIKQYQKYLEDKTRFQIALEFVNNKISTSVNLMKELSRFYGSLKFNNVKSQFDNEIQNYNLNSKDESSPVSDKLKKLMNFEGRIAQIHLEQFRKLATELAPEFKFVGRMNKSNSWNTNASDEVNALLNYGYAILESRVRKSLNSIGLDPTIGFLHEITYGKTLLVYDFQELFRWIIDYSIIQLLDDGKLKKSDFIVTENYHIRLRESTAKRLIEKIKINFNTKIPFRGKNYTYDNVLFYKIQDFANFISEKNTRLDLKIPEFTIKDDDTISLKEKIVKMTPDERKRLGIGKGTLWYMKKNISNGKDIKIYDKVLSKLTD